MEVSNDVSYVKQRPLEDREIKSRQRGMRDLNVCSSELLFLARSNYINRGLNHCNRRNKNQQCARYGRTETGSLCLFIKIRLRCKMFRVVWGWTPANPFESTKIQTITFIKFKQSHLFRQMNTPQKTKQHGRGNLWVVNFCFISILLTIRVTVA